MTEERFVEIMEDDSIEMSYTIGKGVWKGLNIITKYSECDICGAEHDVIYSEDISELVRNGITEEEVITLKKLGWGIEDEYLYHFV